ncbi:hypothetical protein PsYK624_059450 [Phanerochaete sordida]|uniref:Uncharacterized protein n=1 Tax=Phanerochaete sordida TaxID=48140 RepID=A0A9P3G7U8_9APHY|nr:hypothetical protein PsYK624_059450 [Phanerochaete sordida]
MCWGPGRREHSARQPDVRPSDVRPPERAVGVAVEVVASLGEDASKADKDGRLICATKPPLPRGLRSLPSHQRSHSVR